MNVLVTGSSGYLASLILPRLAGDPAVERLLGLDLVPPRTAASLACFEAVAGSVLDPGLGATLARERIDLVIHLAWVFNPTHDREQMRRVDVEGSANVFRAAAEAGVGHVLYLSSTTAYGAHADNPTRLDESAPARGNPDFPYAADKAEVERFLDGFEPAHPGLAITRLRPCIILGRRADNFVRAILDLPVLPRVRGHDPEMQFLHEEDLAECIARLVAARPRGAFNLVPRETVRLSEIGPLLGHPVMPLPAPALRALIGLGWRLRLLGVPPSYVDFIQWPWIADGSRLEKAIGFTPARSSREAILATRRGGTGEPGPGVPTP